MHATLRADAHAAGSRIPLPRARSDIHTYPIKATMPLPALGR